MNNNQNNERKEPMANELTGSMPNAAVNADSKSNDIGKLIYDETEKRLAEMEKPEYEFPKQLKTIDWVMITGICVVSFVLIAMCMTGVIK